MMVVNMEAFEPLSPEMSARIESVLPEGCLFQWGFEAGRHSLTMEDLMLLQMGGVNLVLVSLEKVDCEVINALHTQAVLMDDDGRRLVLFSFGDLDIDFSMIDERPNYAKVNIVGFGPGDPELLTLKALRLLENADIVFYDDLLDHGFLDRFSAKKVYVGKRKGQHSTRQEHINKLLAEAAWQGLEVVRLKGGDPLIFGRGAEEYRYLKSRLLEVEIIPGITSALAAAADAVIPLTCRGVSTSVAFALGHDAAYNKLPKADTLVFYMGASQQKQWARRLINEGWPAGTAVATVRNASLPDREIRYYNLGQLKDEDALLPAPSLVIVGHTASCKPHGAGGKWLYTGSNINDFKGDGIVIHNPMLEVKSVEPGVAEKTALSNLHVYDRIVFASPFAVKEFFKALNRGGQDVRALGRISLVSIGKATSEELRHYGLIVEPATDDNPLDGLVAALREKNVTGERVLLPCSIGGFTEIPHKLLLMGNEVVPLRLYKRVIPEGAVRHNLEEFTGVIFSSPVTVKHFFDFYGFFPDNLVPVIKSVNARQLFERLRSEVLKSE